MRMHHFAHLACAAATVFIASASALTIEREVTPNYIRENPGAFAVAVTKSDDGRIDFAITRNANEPMYHVVHLAIYNGDKLIATSDTPFFGRKGENKVHLSLSVDNIEMAQFSFSDSALDRAGATPVAGTTIYKFRLLDFIQKN